MKLAGLEPPIIITMLMEGAHTIANEVLDHMHCFFWTSHSDDEL